MIGVVFALAPLFLATAGLEVVGESHGCPTGDAVSARLGQLLGDESGGEPPDALIVDGESGALRVRLLSAQVALREEKTLDLQGSCDELADAVATVAVAWRSRLRSDDVPPPVLAARARPVAAPPPPPPPEKPPVPPDFELAYGVQTATGSERWAPGILLGAQVPVGRGFGVTLTANIPAPRSATDDFGKTWRWMELEAILAPFYRAITENFFVDTQFGLGVGLNVTTSESLSAHDSYRRAPPAMVLGMRWTYRRANALPWFGITSSTRLTRFRDSPIHNAALEGEAWWLGLALGGTLALDAH